MSTQAFEAVKVVDLSWAATGPLITKYLADHGATVVRIESASRYDPLRTSGPYKDMIPGANRSGFFAYFNANKYSIAIDLGHPRGLEVARRLVAWGDVVVESFVPGKAERLGLGYEDLTNIKPDIIFLRTSNQGQTGPHAQHPGLGLQLVGLSGFTQLTGWADRPPQPPWGAYTDHIGPFFGTAAVVAALDYRRKTGKGQCIDLAQYETAMHFLAPQILDWTVNGRESQRAGNSCEYAAPHGVYRCKGSDRWCAISVFTDQEWARFCNVIGDPSWTKKPEFSTLLGRKKNEEELDRLVEQWTVNITAEEVMAMMQAAGVAAGVVQNAQDVYNNPQLRHRNHLWALAHREMGVVSHLGRCSKFSKTPAEPRMPAPCLGEHSEFVCKQFLGMSQEEFDELLVRGVFN